MQAVSHKDHEGIHKGSEGVRIYTNSSKPGSHPGLIWHYDFFDLGFPFQIFDICPEKTKNMMKADTDNIVWGIIGCGDVAEVKSGPAFQKVKNSSLLAVMRRNGAKAEDFARRHQVPLWYDSASSILENDEINAVYIATPPSSHLEYALQALEAGKHVYLEKPMVLSKDEADVLTDAVSKSHGKLVVAHYRRFLEMFVKIKDLLRTNTIGDISVIDLKFLRKGVAESSNNWRVNPSLSGGGYFHDIAPHQIDLMYYFFGDIAGAKGFSVNQKGKYEASDLVNGIINFSNGIQFRGIWNFSAPDYFAEDSCTIYGSHGTITFSFFSNEINLTVNGTQRIHHFEHPLHIQQPFIQETVSYFSGRRDNPCSVEEGTIVIDIMDKFSENI